MARQYFDEGLTKARDLGNIDLEAGILNNLGNLFASKKQYTEAIDAQMESVKLSEEIASHRLTATGLTNAAITAIRMGHYAVAPLLLSRALDQTQKTEDSYHMAYSLINIGLAYRDLTRYFPAREKAYLNLTFDTLNQAMIVSEKIGDIRMQSYAMGYLAKVYEDEGQIQDALQLTRRAVFAAQKVSASESLYRWHWQTGRLLKALGKIDEAIGAYRQSLYTLQTIRQEMATCYANPESTFRRTAASMCSELVDLLLKKASTLTKPDEYEPLLLEARDTVELLKVFELRDYFKDDCVDAARSVETRLDTISWEAVVVYPIILVDRMEILVSLPEGLRRHSVRVGADALTREVTKLRKKLEKRTTREFLPHAQRLYDWLIRPIQAELAPLTVDTIVFVPDGILRTIPMSILHDGEHFLVEQYAIGITPGLDLVDPHPIRMEKTKILTLGLTESVQGFAPLPYVSQELRSIQSLYESHGLMDRDFILSNMEHQLKHNPYNIVHIASHGQFGSDIEDTFVLAFDGRLTMERLGDLIGLFQFRDDPLELLTLSACETAAGDERAALGLAGVAIRTGARSALATLWHVNDIASSKLVTAFYRKVRDPSISRAAALRAAQLELINNPRYDHPGYWSPFLLINNWL
jgi:CHAT domain-containing protein